MGFWFAYPDQLGHHAGLRPSADARCARIDASASIHSDSGAVTKIADALRIQRSANATAPRYKALLACGFTPLHLQSLLHAHLQQLLPDRKVELDTGLFGDLVGTIQAMAMDPPHAVLVVLEWTDLDPRLGYREAHSWESRVSEEIVANSEMALDRLAAALESIEPGPKIVLATPTLALPPLFDAAPWCAAPGALRLKARVAAFMERANAIPNLALLDDARLSQHSPQAGRFDPKADLLFGFPYTQPHADQLAEAFARIIAPLPPKKGLITDLDDTLWHGILGEVGAAGIQWDLSSHQQLHGLYQTLLQSLSDAGTLIAIASKNDADAVQEALTRSDLRISPQSIFPIEAHWEPKSQSVSRILKAWNIAADSVVFVDDSPHELAEVAAAHPDIQCLRFPSGDAEQGVRLLHQIRDLFSRGTKSQEDLIRVQSVRSMKSFTDTLTANTTNTESFLSGLDADIQIDFSPAANDARSLELINKTNQFNLNGKRFLEAEWSQRAKRAGAWLAGVSYSDKFGPLGKIAVMEGWESSQGLHVGVWVMSCRAFSRRIEFACLKTLFEYFAVSGILLEFSETKKNAPMRDFLSLVSGRDKPFSGMISRDQFETSCPKLYQRVKVVGEKINA